MFTRTTYIEMRMLYKSLHGLELHDKSIQYYFKKEGVAAFAKRLDDTLPRRIPSDSWEESSHSKRRDSPAADEAKEKVLYKEDEERAKYGYNFE